MLNKKLTADQVSKDVIKALYPLAMVSGPYVVAFWVPGDKGLGTILNGNVHEVLELLNTLQNRVEAETIKNIREDKNGNK